MGQAEVRAYRETKAAWEARRGRVEGLAGEIERVAEALRHNPMRFMVSNVPGGATPGLRLSGTVVLDGQRWPTGEALAALLTELREAAVAVRNAWAALSEEERAEEEPAEGAIF